MLRRLRPDRACAGLPAARGELRAARRTCPEPHWRCLLVPLLALGVLGSLLPRPWCWIAGLGSGLVVALWLALDDRLRWVERWRATYVAVQRASRVLDGSDAASRCGSPAGVRVLVGRSYAAMLEPASWSPTARPFADDHGRVADRPPTLSG